MIKLAHGGAKLALAGFVLSLAACGGGGGGGGGGGSDLSTAPGLAVSPASLSFTAVHNGTVPSAQNIQVTISRPDAVAIIVGFPPSVAPPTWLDRNPNLFSCTLSLSNCTLIVAIVNTSPAPGTYATTLRFLIANSNQSALAFRDVQVSFTVTPTPAAANPNALNFSSVAGGAAPAAQSVALTGDVGAWTASADQTWLGVAPSSGSGAGNVSVSVNPAGLSPSGSPYAGSVTFNTANGTASVGVTLVVSAPAIQANHDSLTFSGINGATIAAQSLNIGLNNGAAFNWNASTPLADTWLILSRTSGTASDPLSVSVNPANGTLASGTYNSTITLTGSFGGSPLNKTVSVSMTLTKATLMPNPVSVTLGGANGRDFSGVPVQLSLNTDVNAFAWNSNGSSTFVQRAPASGTVSATPVSVTLTPDATGLTGGTHTGQAAFTAQVNGDLVTASIPVTFNQESHKLLVDGNGVAFAKTPSLSKLTRTLKVRDDLGLPTSWTAAKTQPWLTVTGSGTAGDDLVLTADPTGLAADSLSFDTVTITSSDASVENTEKVRVGLWVGSADPAATTSIGITTANVAADPIRPYAYAAVGGDIKVYNVYTGSLVATVTGVSSGTVGFMTVSHDGSTLYALDTTNSEIVPVNLDTQAAGTPFSVSLLNPVSVIDYTRTNGVELILSGNGGQIFDPKTGLGFLTPFAGNTVVAASRGGTRFCTVDVGISAYSISCPTLDFTSLNGGRLLLGNTSTVSGVSGNGKDVALSGDGASLYVASGGVSELSKYLTSGSNPSYVGAGNSPAPTGLHPNNAEIAWDGRILASAPILSTDPADVWVFDANGAPLTTLKISAGGVNQVIDRQLRVSGDGIRLITITGDQGFNTNFNLNFTTLP